MAVQDTVPPTTASGVFVVAVWLATHLLIFVPAYAQTEKFFYISCGTIALVRFFPLFFHSINSIKCPFFALVRDEGYGESSLPFLL